MSDCDYDGAGEALEQIYGPLNDPAPVTDTSGKFIEFPQNEFFEPPGLDPEQLRNRLSFNELGYAYVPQTCERGEPCKVHVVFHGCKQVYDKNPESDDANDTTHPFGLKMVFHSGFNEWANTNNLIILYPQAERVSVINPLGCFDWWGYVSGTQQTYATKAGPQMAAVYAMLERLAAGGNQPPRAEFAQNERQGENLLVAGTVTDPDDPILGVDIKFAFPPNQITDQKPVNAFDSQSGAFSHSEAWPQDNTSYTVVLLIKYQDNTIFELHGPNIPVSNCRQWTETNSAHLEAQRAYRQWRFFWFHYYAVGSDDSLGYSGWSTSTLREEGASQGIYHEGACP
jgi:hypothetical protein